MSALDGSFLRLESPRAHMHVGWSGVFAAPNDRPRPTVLELRERVASRLDRVPWCRWRLQRAPLALSEPSWVDDREFDLAAHVLGLAEDGPPLSYAAFAELRDELLSAPLDHSRPLWQIFLIPWLEDGRVGIIGKIHHALVDGIAALQIVSLVVDNAPDGPPDPPASPPSTEQRSAVGWALGRVRGTFDRVSGPALAGLPALKATATAAARPDATARAIVRVLRAARDDLLPGAAQSKLNAPIGPRRTLAGFHADRAALRAARASGGTLNDIGLTVVAGALRALSLDGGETPKAPLKAMVPVSVRRLTDTGPGNQISMIYIQLPVHLASPRERLESVRAQTERLKTGQRAANMQSLYAAAGLLPAPLRSPVTRALASPRVFNLTVSQSPGPHGTVHMLGCELEEVYSVVPIADRHALAIGMVRYRHELFIGCFADPDALPEVRNLPALLQAELRALAGATSPSPTRPGRAPSNGRAPAPAGQPL